MEKRFIGINLIADQSAYTWGLIHQGQMLITFINIDRGYRMHQQNIYTTEIHKRVIYLKAVINLIFAVSMMWRNILHIKSLIQDVLPIFYKWYYVGLNLLLFDGRTGICLYVPSMQYFLLV